MVYTDISDHLGIILLVNRIHCLATKTKKPVFIQSITSSNLEAFRQAITREAWNSVYWAEDSDSAHTAFITTFKALYHEHFPMKKNDTAIQSTKT